MTMTCVKSDMIKERDSRAEMRFQSVQAKAKQEIQQKTAGLRQPDPACRGDRPYSLDTCLPMEPDGDRRNLNFPFAS